MLNSMLTTIVCAITIARVALASDFAWSFPASTVQCQNAEIEVYGGIAPWYLFLIPIYGLPIIWTLGDVNDTASATTPWTFSPPITLDAGTQYVVYIRDSDDYYNTAAGAMKPMQIVGTGDNSCMQSVVPRVQEFYFNVGGTFTQCQNFGIYYDDAIGVGPYYSSIVTLDGSLHPYNTNFGSDQAQSIFQQLRLPAGTRFTVVMGNANGYGTGGIGGIYEVAAGTDSSCLISGIQPTSSWPSGATPTTIGPLVASVPLISGARVYPSTASTSETPSTTSSATTSSSSSSSRATQATTPAALPHKINIAAIAGGAAAAAIVVAVFALLALFCLKRRRRQRSTVRPVDLGDQNDAYPTMSKIEPYRSSAHAEHPEQGHLLLDPQMSPTQYYDWSTGVRATGSAGFAGDPLASPPMVLGPLAGTYSHDRNVAATSSGHHESSIDHQGRKSYVENPAFHGHRGTARYVQHTDGGMTGSDSDIVELPPSYNDAGTSQQLQSRDTSSAGKDGSRQP